jgi:hypothetical protein
VREEPVKAHLHFALSFEEQQWKKKVRNLQSRPACRRHRLYMFFAWLDGRRAEEYVAQEALSAGVCAKYCFVP